MPPAMHPMMRGSSASSLSQLTTALGLALSAEAGDAAAGAAVGDDLFAATDAVRGSAALRRAATDPSAPAAAKSALLARLFDGKLGEPAVELVATAASYRWTRGSDLPDALDRLGVTAHVLAADATDSGDRLEDELFTVAQAVRGDRELRDAFSDPSRSAVDKQGLVHRLLDGKAHPSTITLAGRAATAGHLTAVLAAYSEVAASARRRLIATVTAAAPLAADDQQRLAAVLTRDYGRPVHLNLVVDPSILGGVRVEIGDQVIDGTISARLEEATRRLAG
ncbi:MAG: F0F1 ATP synthase subunit delta [Nocardioides sp.]